MGARPEPRGRSADGLWGIYLLWLAVATISLWPYIWVFLTGLTHLGPAQGGYLMFSSTESNPTGRIQIFPITVLALALSILGVAYFVARAERPHRWAIPLALAVGAVASIGMVNVYEQPWVTLLSIRLNFYYWPHQYWGPAGIATTLFGMSWVGAALPWWRKENARPALVAAAAYAVLMAIWWSLGYPQASEGSPVGFVLNQLTRLISQLLLVVLVADRAVLRAWWDRLGSYGRRVRTGFDGEGKSRLETRNADAPGGISYRKVSEEAYANQIETSTRPGSES
jgi:hypothetical protein